MLTINSRINAKLPQLKELMEVLCNLMMKNVIYLIRFLLVFTTDDGLNSISDFIFAPQPDVNLDFSPANISKIIHNMNKNSCAGSDCIPALFWNKLPLFVLSTVYNIFNIFFYSYIT